MKQIFAVLILLLFLASCAGQPQLADDEDESTTVERLPSVAPLELNIDPTAGLIAYQRNKQLWLAKANLSGDSFKLAECVEPDKVICDLSTVHWSPDGSRFFYEITVEGEHRLLISDLRGQHHGCIS